MALDGANNVWFGNKFPSVDATSGENGSTGIWSVGEMSTSGGQNKATFTALSPAAPGLLGGDTCNSSACPAGGGFQKNSLQETPSISIDPSGNVWALNQGTASQMSSGSTGGTNITEIVGAAVPVVTPLSEGAANGMLATKP